LATLSDLQQGRTLYISHCGQCHDLYLPENFSASQWRSILPNMAPRTSLTSAEVQLVTKYVTKGK
jgi:mono/diheme cytochrome c family protein